MNDTDDVLRLTRLQTELEELYTFITKGRREGIAKDGEQATQNIVFKVLRRSGRLDMLRHLKYEIYDKINSI